MDGAQAVALKEARRRLALRRRLVLQALGSKEAAPEPLWKEIHALSREIGDIDRQLGAPRVLAMPSVTLKDQGRTAVPE